VPRGTARSAAARGLEPAVTEDDFEGSIVLEQLAAIDEVDAFFEAIDADDVPRAVSLMRKADIDAATIAVVVKKMQEADGKH
jgi:hypothetical protein